MTEPSFLEPIRAAYDTVAAEYAALYRDELSVKPLDRALLAGFADLVRGVGDGTVADLGCGPGHLTAHLNGLGLKAFGIDLSPEMVALARRSHPGVRYEVGSMTALDLPDGALSGALAFYSIVHTPSEALPGVFAEIHRVLAPGGYALVAFQVGDEVRDITESFGHPVSMRGYLRLPAQVGALLSEAGLLPHAQLVREPDPDLEGVPQAFLITRKAAAPAR